MEAEYDISNNLLENVEEIPQKSDSSCYKFFCCLCLWFESNNTDKKKYIKKWREYLNKEAERDITCFRTITNLWAHKNVIEDLEKVRLNPNLVSIKGIRNDLEFYIPQICTFLIFGDYEKCEELLAFLCKACFASFFFAHRILWFLRSMLKIKAFEVHYDKIYERIILVESIYKSEKDFNRLERLDIANSKKYVDFIRKRNLEFLYNVNEKFNWSEITKNTSNNLLYDQLTRMYLKNFEQTDNLNRDFILKHLEFLDDLGESGKKSNIKEFKYSHKINPEDTFIRIFKNIHENTSDNEYRQTLAIFQDSVSSSMVQQNSNNNNNENTSKDKDTVVSESKLKDTELYKNDVNLKAFLSTMNFVDSLCNICKDAVAIPTEEQIIFIKREISDLNKELPANVYIPFLNGNVRNHVVVHMPVSELRIFRTKTRVLYMTTVEMVRIDEIINSVDTIENKKVINISNNFDNSVNFWEEASNRGRSYSMATSYNDYLEKKKNKKVSPKESKKNLPINNSFVNLLDENDINLSKPITIDTLLHEKKIIKTTNKKDKDKNKTIIEDEAENCLNESSLRGNDIEKMIKRRITQSSKYQKRFSCAGNDTRNHKKSSKTFLSGQFVTESYGEGDLFVNDNKIDLEGNLGTSEKEPIFEKQENYLEREKDYKHGLTQQNKEDLIKEKDANVFNSVEYDQKSRSNSFYSEIGNPKNLLNEEEEKNSDIIKFKKSQSNLALLSNHNTEAAFTHNLPTNTDIISNTDIKKIFGELLDQQAERIRKASPYGNFKTWKMSKIIVKGGEDLIQEQFATQLINEFYQIFQIEKVNCWVNPYEILSTGNESGIIECVGNAISIDDLKKKIKNMTLREFFLKHFGPQDSKEFKNAMNNFIQSLAGYSLLCYFLQIKDRHNANILLDNQGHIVHIDFGFLLSNAPGKGIKFEKAPFKLTDEFVECMGGVNSSLFKKFRHLLWSGFVALVKHSQKIIILVEMMYAGFGDTLGCFSNKENTIRDLKHRFFPKPGMETKHYFRHVDSLIEQSIDNWRTRWYDKFQYVAQGIFY